MTSLPASLFVLAHQDDEMAAVARIDRERKRGLPVYCVFLTDGGGGKATPQVRNQESIAVLTHIGVLPENIFFSGSDIPVGDGQLVHHLNPALEHLESLLSGIEVGNVYCLAWEGGHQDHDASHLVAVAFSRRHGLLDRCFEVPLYRAWIGPFFRVLSPRSKRDGWVATRLAFADGFRLSLLAGRYRSQRGSWIGLFPETFLKLAILRREVVRKVDISRLRLRPHAGILFYERRFRFPFERFMTAAAPFVDTHLRRD